MSCSDNFASAAFHASVFILSTCVAIESQQSSALNHHIEQCLYGLVYCPVQNVLLFVQLHLQIDHSKLQWNPSICASNMEQPL